MDWAMAGAASTVVAAAAAVPALARRMNLRRSTRNHSLFVLASALMNRVATEPPMVRFVGSARALQEEYREVYLVVLI